MIQKHQRPVQLISPMNYSSSKFDMLVWWVVLRAKETFHVVLCVALVCCAGVLCWCVVLVVVVTPAMTECIQHNTNYPARRMFALHQKPSNLIFSGDIVSLPINQVYILLCSVVTGQVGLVSCF